MVMFGVGDQAAFSKKRRILPIQAIKRFLNKVLLLPLVEK